MPIANAIYRPRRFAKGRIRIPGTMNKTERAYADRLEVLKVSGEIAAWEYERFTLKLAPDTRYTPDFWVLLPDGAMEFHETKGGFVREDADLKWKLAAERFPWFRFVMAQRIKGAWSIKRDSWKEGQS